VALVIGNSAYSHTPALTNPRNDATDMAAALRKLGFDLVEGFDLGKSALEGKLREFATALRGASVGVFFYAGHGIQVSGQNYLVPVDARLEDAIAVDFELVRLELVQRAMEQATPTNILFLDACRDNPLARNLARTMGTRSGAIGSGLNRMEAGGGTLISFSTQPGNVALDGTGRNSPFAGALLEHVDEPGAELSATLIKVRRDVMKETQNRQVPWEHSALIEAFYFSPRQQQKSPPSAVAAAAPGVGDAERAWADVKGTRSIAALEAFIARYKDPLYGELARERIEDLKRQAVAPPPARATPDPAPELTASSAPSAPSKQPPPGRPAGPAQPQSSDAERAWTAVQDAKSIPALEAFIARHQDTPYAELARRLIADLKRQQVAVAAPAAAKVQPSGPSPQARGAVRANMMNASVLRSIAVSPTGAEFAVSGDDGLIRIIDARTFRLLRRFPDRADGVSVKSVTYSGDGSLLMAGRFDGKAEVWNAATGVKAEDLESSISKIFAVAYYPPQLHRWAVTAGSDGIEIWNMQRKTVAGRPGLHKGSVRALAYSSEKSGIFVSGGEDGQLVFYLPGNRQHPVQAHKGGVFAAAFSLDDQLVVTGGADGLVKLWNAKKQSEEKSFKGHVRYVLSVALSKTGTRIASGGADKRVRIWSVADGKALQAFEGHEKDVESVQFLRGDELLLSISEDRTMRLWDVGRGQQVLTAVFYSDGEYLAYTGKGLFTGTAGAARRLEVASDGQWQPLSDAEIERLYRTAGLEPAER
jgi:uncharacterized caspase-like protein/WD40 repeat protein